MDSNSTDPSTPGVPTSQPMNPVTAAFIMLGVTVGAILLHLVLTFIFSRLAKKTIWQFDDDLVKYCKKPTFIMFPVIALLITIQLVTLPLGVYGTLNHVLVILLLFTISFFLVMLIKCGSLAVSRSNSHIKDSAPKRAREVETQIVVMTRIVQGMVWLLGLSGVAMTFPNAWQVGVSLLASASVSALLLGFAAKPSIENALASLTIALTQPFLLEDQVGINGEVGHIEEIQSQYVIVRTLDERRLVIPLTWFIANIFQNWSRNSSQQIAECKLYVDYTVSVPRIRQVFLKFARAHPLYDGRHCSLLVTDCTSSTIILTCQISVRNAMDVMQVTSDVREAMVEFISKAVQLRAGVTGTEVALPPAPPPSLSLATTQASSPDQSIHKNSPPASPPSHHILPTISLLGLGIGKSTRETEHHAAPAVPAAAAAAVAAHKDTGPPPSPPLPPLTLEDQKMGLGSKLYKTYSSINGVDATTGSSKKNDVKSSGASTSISPAPSRDHVQVDVEGGGGQTSTPMAGLTRRSIRDAADQREAVVPAIVAEK
ncbi:hypothetical protein BGZ83_001613 [Gryganskiella cystojenkinii]|nr:hypothetical protein BGZ83_001613 [Gryganskiella cystojenkinii]